MKIRVSLANRDWRVKKSLDPLREPDKVLDYSGTIHLIATCDSYETAAAIAALPKLYGACLANLGALRQALKSYPDPQGEEARGDTATLERNIRITQDALDLANIADEP